MDSHQIRTDCSDSKSSHPCDQIKPVCANVGNGSESTPLTGKHSPVVVGALKKPVLNVASVHMQNFPQTSILNPTTHLRAKRIKADVVVNGRRQLIELFRQMDKLSRFLAVHRQRLFAKNMLAGFQGS